MSNESVIREIERALTYNENWTKFSEYKRKYANTNGIKVIDNLKKKWRIR